MSIIKKASTVIFFTSLSTTLFFSCKKGPEDPFLSFRSRKARLEGSWKVKFSEYIDSTFSASGVRVETNESDESTFTHTVTNVDLTGNFHQVYYAAGPVDSLTYTFSKDGTWSSLRDYITIENDTDQSTGTTTNYKKQYRATRTGLWSFIDGTKGYTKNKERIQLSVLQWNVKTVTTITETTGSNAPVIKETTTYENNTYTPDVQSFVWILTRLSNKEIKSESESAHGYSFEDRPTWTTGNTFSYNTKSFGTLTLIQE